MSSYEVKHRNRGERKRPGYEVRNCNSGERNSERDLVMRSETVTVARETQRDLAVRSETALMARETQSDKETWL